MLRRRLLIAALAALPLVGCLSPTLPLPPPGPPSVDGPSAEGTVRLSGSIPVDDAQVMAWNQNTGEIAGQRTVDGRYDFEIGAIVGEVLVLRYIAGTDLSPAIHVKIREPQPDP